MLKDCGFALPQDPQKNLFPRGGVMMTTDAIEQDFKQKVCKQLRLASEGVSRYRVFTPFMFEDGDHLAVVLKKNRGTMAALG